ncbi:MAG: hypothetical protein IE922_14450 [Sphingomonadales bacterium]|nr:hypothetical protein [Sphingomonadales bacterium]
MKWIIVGVGLVAAGLGSWALWLRGDLRQARADLTAAQIARDAFEDDLGKLSNHVAAANAAAAQLAKIEGELLAEREARQAAERRLFDAFDTDPGLSGPGVPAGVLDDIRAHWGEH